MTQPRQPKQRPLAERMYALWLHLYPRAHRDAYGALMLQLFRDMCRDALAAQGRIGMRVWLGVAADEARSMVREHGAALNQRPPQLARPAYALAYGALLLGVAAIYIAICPH